MTYKDSRCARTMFTMEEMFAWAEKNEPTDRIYITDGAVNGLLRFLMKIGRLSFDPDDMTMYGVTMDPDIIFAGLIKMRDCEINWKDTKSDSYSAFRVVLFPQYRDILSDADEMSAVFGFISVRNIVVPLGVRKGDEGIGFGDIFFKDNTCVDFCDSAFDSGESDLRDMIVSIAAVWYAIQIASMDPTTKDLFKYPIAESGKDSVRNYNLTAGEVERFTAGP